MSQSSPSKGRRYERVNCRNPQIATATNESLGIGRNAGIFSLPIPASNKSTAVYGEISGKIGCFPY